MRRRSRPFAVARRLQSGNKISLGPRRPEYGRPREPWSSGSSGRSRSATSAARWRWVGVKPRAVLAVLLLHRNEPVSAERLALALWGEDAPARRGQDRAGARLAAAQGARRRGRPRPRRRPATACACAPGSSTPSASSSSSRTAARRWPPASPSRRRPCCARRSTLWRGPPLAELAFEPFAQAEIARLEEQRLAARRGARGGRPRRGPRGRARRRAAAARRRPPDARAAGRAAHARALPLRPAGRGARGLPRRRAGCWSPRSASSPGRSSVACRRRSCARTPRSSRAAARAELPRELDAATAPPLVGRDARSSPGCASAGSRPRAGAGALVTVHRRARDRQDAAWPPSWPARPTPRRRRRSTPRARAPPTPCSARCVRAREATRPTLLVIDDADRRRCRRARRRSCDSSRAVADVPVLVLVLAGDDDARALARLGADGSLLLEPLDVEAVHAIAVALRARPRRRGSARRSGCSTPAAACPRRVHELAGQWARREAARRVGAVAERAAAGPRRAALDGGRAGRRRRRPRRRRASTSRCVTDDDEPGRVPVQGARVLRRRRRAVLLRARAARRRARRAARRRAAARRRRAVGQRQVVGRAGRAAARARGRRAARQRAAGRRCSSGPASIRCASCATRSPACGDRRMRARRRPVRGDLHHLPRRGASARRSSPRSCARPATRPREPSWSSRSGPTTTGAARRTRSCRACSPPTTCWSGRCSPTSCAGRSSSRRTARACASSPSSPTRSWPTPRTSPARCRCCRPRCSSSGSTATGGACATPTTSAPGGVRGAVARLAEDAFERLDDASRPSRAAVFMRLAARGRRGRRRAPPRPAGRARDRGDEDVRERRRAARRRAPAHGQRGIASRSPTRPCCASGRGCAAGSRRTARACGSTAG